MYKPQFPYNGSHAYINSDRIIINSKNDSIFLFSSKAISLSSNEGVHINTDKECIINASKIQLGLNATEPIVRGNQLIYFLNKLLESLEFVATQLNNTKDSNNNPIPTIQTAGNSLLKSINRLKILTESINSTNNFTI